MVATKEDTTRDFTTLGYLFINEKYSVYFVFIFVSNKLNNLLHIEEQQSVGQDKELHFAGQGPTPIGAHVPMVEEVLNEQKIAPPVPCTHLIESLVDVVNRDISNIGVYQVHGGHDHQVKRSKTQITMEEQFAKEF